jgi:PAS domain S-box-containing protein
VDLTGYSLADLQAMDDDARLALYHPDDQALVSDHLARLREAANGESLEVEYRFCHRDGSWVWCLSRDSVLERDARGIPSLVVGAFVDIGRRKRAEDALSHSEARVSAHQAEIELIYDSAPVGLCVLDRELRYVRINQRLAEINGIPAEDHLGKTVRELMPSVAEDIEGRLRRVIETGEPALDVEVVGETPARPGVRRTWIESWLPLKTPDGEVTAISVVAEEVTDERLALAELAESRERYRLVADYTYDWEYWVGSDGDLRWVSPSCERITGHSADAFVSDPGLMERIVIPQDRELMQHHRREVHSGGPERLQFRIRHADGAIRWLEHVCHPIFTPDGRFAGRRVSTRDITEAKDAEEALLRREQQFAGLAENSPDIIARFDRGLRHLYVNSAVVAATGRPTSDFLGRTNEELGMPPHLCARWAEATHAVFRDGEPQTLDFSFPAPDGERFYNMRMVPELGPDGTVETVLSATRDETARRHAQARAATLVTLVETSADFIGVAELDGRAAYLNRAGMALVGLDDAAAVLATKVEDYFLPADLPFLRDTILPVTLDEGIWSGDYRFRHFQTGEAIDVHFYLMRIDDPETGEPRQLASVTRDIRPQKAYEAALLEADRRKDEFLSVLGHELRNPMAPIRNAVEILQLLMREGNNPRVDWALQVLDRHTGHLGRLLDDLLDVSRIVRGKIKLERRPIGLREIVEQAADGVRSLVDERQQHIEVELPDPAVQVDGDPVRLVQVLLNLLLNAANYTHEGGEIGIAVEVDATRVVVRVRDNGPGIAPDRIEELFNPFSQGGSEDRPSPRGLGLGLTISRRLAELHGGDLEAASDWPDPGSTFSLSLPRVEQDRGVVEEPPPQPIKDHPGVRVLVVDDTPDVASAMAMLLELLGYRVEIALSGAEALDKVAEWHPRVALVDIGLPDMDGLELARRLRERFPSTEDLLLVAVTGFGHDEARARSLAAGFDQHLAKPVDLDTLQGLLAAV